MKAKSILSSAIAITAFLVQFSFTGTSHAKIIYVDDDAAGANDGSS